MTDEQIDIMVKMHRYLMKCEIRQALDSIGAENGNGDYRAAKLQEAFNDTKWDDFAKWFKVIRDD